MGAAASAARNFVVAWTATIRELKLFKAFENVEALIDEKPRFRFFLTLLHYQVHPILPLHDYLGQLSCRPL